MPNDPRVKFKKKKIYDTSRNVIYFGGEGSGGMRSIFEDGTPPPDRPDLPDPGGGGTGGGGGVTPREIPVIPQPLKPGLNPGEITGITIGSLAAAAAAAELTRRTIEEARRRRGGEQPVSQDDRPLSTRQSGGQHLERRSRANLGRSISKGINRAVQSSFEMMTPTPTYRPVPIQAEMVPPSGTAQQLPVPEYQRAQAGGQRRGTADNVVMRDPIHSSLLSIKPLDTDPNRLSTIFTTPEGTIGEIKASPITKPPPPIRKPDVPLDLQNELEKKQLELNIERARIVPDDRYFNLVDEYAPHRLPREGISEGRINTLKSEIKALERKIKSRGIPAEASETSRRILNMALEDRAAIESAGGVGIGSGTRAETELSRQGLADRIDQLNREQFVRDVAKSERIAQESVALENRLIANQELRNRNYSESLINLTPEERARLERTSLFDINDPNSIATMTDAEFEAFMERSGINYKRTPGDVSPDIDRFNFLEGAIENIDLKLMDRQLPIARREQLIAEQKELKSTLALEQEVFNRVRERANLKAATEKINIPKETPAGSRSRISKKIAPETPIANNPINDKINAARQTQGTEMMETGLRANAPLVESTATTTTVEVKTRGPTIFEQTRTAIQKATSRKPIEAKVKIDPIPKPPKPPTQTAATKAALERARAASGLSTDVKMRPVVVQPEESTGRLSNEAYRQLLEGLPEDEIVDMMRLREQLNELRTGNPLPQDPGGERPTPERPPPENFGTELRDAAELTFRDRPVDRFNNMYDLMTERWRAHYSDSVPTAPEGLTEIEGKKYVMDQILKEQAANGDPIHSGDTKQVEISLEEALNKVQTAYEKTDPNIQSKQLLENIERTGKGLKPNQKRKLTKKTGLLVTEEQRLPPTALAGEAQARVQSRAAAPAEVRAGAPVEAARAPTAQERLAQRSQEIRSGQQEINRLVETQRAAPAPEVSARRQLSAAPELTAGRPAPPEERASFAERQAFFEETSRRVAPPTETPAPSAPPSAPESEISTPREGIVTERTPAERAGFVEEVRLGLSKKPGRQKAKVNFGKTKPNTRNPLDIFVNPEFRNVPNTELHPTTKSFRGTLTEFSSGSRVPRLMPSRSTLINMSAEGGGTIGGLAAGYFATEAMNDYFAQHPARNFGEAYGQALAAGLTGAVVGAITQQVVSAAIRAGVEYAIAGEIAGGISGLGAGPMAIGAAIAEAALYTTVAVTTQMTVQKQLDDAGYTHSFSRGMSAVAVTGALTATNIVTWLAKGGPINPAADVSALVNEIFILGFGIYSLVTEHDAGQQQDWDEYYLKKEAQKAEHKAEHERMDRVERTMRMNVVRKDFILKLKLNDYDFDKTLALFNEEEQVALGVYSLKGQAPAGYSYEEFVDGLKAELNPLYQSERDTALEAGGLEGGGVVLTGDEKLKHDTYVAYVTSLVNDYYGIPNETPFNWNSPGVKLLDAETAGSWTFTAETTASSAYVLGSKRQVEINTAQNQVLESFVKERKTMQELDPQLVAIANADKNFNSYYNTYIVAAAQAEIYMEFNRTQFTYHDMDQKLVEIANRDPTFQGAIEHYYEVMSSMARDLDLTITEVARLNALAANDQAIEIGKLNDARNKIIAQTQERNQAEIDRYNASIIQEISVYGDNFEAIIRNINDQSLLTGHTFLYATNRADLYRQLHMEMPELELVDPEVPTNIGDPNRNPTYQDLTIMYPEQYRRLYQNYLQNGYSPEEANTMTEEALRVLYKDSPVPLPAIISVQPAKGRKIGDTALYGYRYNLTDEQNQELEDMIASGKITRKQESSQAKIIYNRDRYLFEKTDKEKADDLGMTLEAYYAKYGMPVPPEPEPEPEPSVPIAPGTEPSYTQLQQKYPETYKNLLQKHANDPDKDSLIEAALKRAYASNFDEAAAAANAGDPTIDTGVTPVTPTTTSGEANTTREPTYEELKIMYPDRYQRIFNSYNTYGDPTTADELTELVLREVYQDNPVPLPASTTPTTTPTTPPTPTTTEPTYAQLVQMYGNIFAGTNNPEANLRALHADNVSQGTAPPIPTTQPTTQRPGLDVVPEFTPGARSHEYMNPAPSAATTAPAPAPSAATTAPAPSAATTAPATN